MIYVCNDFRDLKRLRSREKTAHIQFMPEHICFEQNQNARSRPASDVCYFAVVFFLNNLRQLRAHGRQREKEKGERASAREKTRRRKER